MHCYIFFVFKRILFLGVSTAEEDFKCYKCTSILDDYCDDIDALKAAGDEAQRDCSKYKQCLYEKEGKKLVKHNIEL